MLPYYGWIASAAVVCVAWFYFRRPATGTLLRITRYPIKGLAGDRIDVARVMSGGSLAFDRSFALERSAVHLKGDDLAAPDARFDGDAPSWRHKSAFHCAFNARALLAPLAPTYSLDKDGALVLSLHDRRSGESLLERCVLKREGHGEGNAEVERFFGKWLNDPGLRLVSSRGSGRAFQFNNTTAAEAVLHLVSVSTVAACAARFAMLHGTLSCERFRPNLVVEGLEPWVEFTWVGFIVAIGPDVRCAVRKRTVRCAATAHDALSGQRNCDVPAQLEAHFPEHGPYLGVYLEVLRGGTLRAGDVVRVTAERA